MMMRRFQPFQDPLLAEPGEVARAADLDLEDAGELDHPRKDKLWTLIGYALENLIAPSAPKTLQAQ